MQNQFLGLVDFMVLAAPFMKVNGAANTVIGPIAPKEFKRLAEESMQKKILV